MARRLAREEGILVRRLLRRGHGGRAAARLRPGLRGKTIVTVLPDSGERYLSGPLYEGLFAEVETMAASPAQAVSAAVGAARGSSRGCWRATAATRGRSTSTAASCPRATRSWRSSKLLLELFYPGYFGRQDLTDENLPSTSGNLLSTLREKVERQVETCLCFAAECEGAAAARLRGRGAARRGGASSSACPRCATRSILDVQAAYDGDPAASSLDEVILAYPGMLAVTVHRVAHELHVMGVPLMPRIMSEWAHSRSGADIHPGARIGRSFFIDHATGVVVGETTTIGSNVKLYQGVTLGALSIPRDERGRVIRDTKRHPTVEDGVTIYANATVLGGADGDRRGQRRGRLGLRDRAACRRAPASPCARPR